MNMNKKEQIEQIEQIITSLEQTVKSQPVAKAYKTGYLHTLNRLKQDIIQMGDKQNDI